MLKKTITFKDLDGNPVTEDFYFSLSKAEIAEIELSIKGGLTDHLQQIIAAEDGGTIIALFKKILMMSVGRRADDNKRFIKNQEIRDAFEQTDAYSVMFMELVTDASLAAEFIRGVVPADLQQAVEAGERVTDLQLPDDQPAWVKEDRLPTEAELVGATPDQLREAFRRKQAQ